MKKEVRQKTVDYEVFVTDDGAEFNNEKEAILHERMLKGEIKECPECHGKGKIQEWVDDEDYHTGAPWRHLEYHTCTMCHGKGYLERKIEEKWV